MMGIRGLTTFIAHDSSRYMKNIKLNNSYLVVDGNCVASHLYKWCSKRDSAFGGDYDEYYGVVKQFFNALKKSKIIPIIIFDGGYEEKKIKTVVTRLKEKLMTLKTTFAKGFSSKKFFPIFMKDVFCDVVNSFDFTIIQCELEADGVIADLAKQLNCPVLSYDSDFYVFDVLYIPLSTVELDFGNISSVIDGLPCSIYKLEDFLDEYPGLSKCHLPLVCTLLGNDFVPSQIFINFFKQIPLAHLKNATNSAKRILGLLNWLRHESEASALAKIESFIGKNNFKLFQSALELSKESYELNSGYTVEINNDRICVKHLPFTLNLDKKYINLLVSCKLPSIIINMINLRRYFLPLQVEDVTTLSAHEVALPIIKVIDGILCSFTGNEEELVLFIRNGKYIKQKNLSSKNHDGSSMKSFIQVPTDKKSELFFELIKLETEDKECVDSFPKDCQLFISCFIYWSKYANPSASHMHAVLFGFLGSQAKYRVGPCRTGQNSGLNINHLVSFTSKLGPYRKTSDLGKRKFNCAIVHIFSQFQSILYHCFVLNTLLGYPMVPCKIADCFNGTLSFNLFIKFDSDGNILKTIEDLLIETDNILHLYKSYWDVLERYFSVAPVAQSNKVKRKRKKVKRGANLADQVVNMPEDNPADDSDAYSDVNNKFYALNIQ